MTMNVLQNLKGKPDTYIQVFLLPGKHKEVKTKVVKNNPNPSFVETIKFQLPLESLHERMIVLQVIDKDTFTKDDKLGEVQIALNSIDLNRRSIFVREIGPVTTITSTKSPSKSSSSRDSSYVEDGRKSPRKSAPGGPSMLKYRIEYEHMTRKLLVKILEARVRSDGERSNYIIHYLKC